VSSRYRGPRLFAAPTATAATPAGAVVAVTAVAALARPGRLRVHRLLVVDRPEHQAPTANEHTWRPDAAAPHDDISRSGAPA
jgi:hypothetical protein